jgi:uronate dehydrogenase
VCLRIGGLEPEPSQARHLATWLSPGGCVRWVRGAVPTCPQVSFTAVYAVSANSRRFWELDDRLGYRPGDDAEAYADRTPEAERSLAGDQLQGGDYAAAGYTRPHLLGR